MELFQKVALLTLSICKIVLWCLMRLDWKMSLNEIVCSLTCIHTVCLIGAMQHWFYAAYLRWWLYNVTPCSAIVSCNSQLQHESICKSHYVLRRLIQQPCWALVIFNIQWQPIFLQAVEFGLYISEGFRCRSYRSSRIWKITVSSVWRGVPQNST